MKRELSWFIGIIIIILIFSFTVYPTRYYFSQIGMYDIATLRIDRFTGEAQCLVEGHWKVCGDKFIK